MKPEKQQLIHDLLDGENRREITLLAGTKILRRRRHRRVVWRTLAVMALAAATVLFVKQNRQQRTLAQISPPQTKPAAPLQAQSLTDEQLLSLFPNTPVGLATLPNGKKLLIFPRPGDAAKFISRL
jgi:glucose/arabinose dehydrogenase